MKTNGIVMTVALAAIVGLSMGTATAAGSQPYVAMGDVPFLFVIDSPSASVVDANGAVDVSVVPLASGLHEVEIRCLEPVPFVCTGTLVW